MRLSASQYFLSQIEIEATEARSLTQERFEEVLDTFQEFEEINEKISQENYAFTETVLGFEVIRKENQVGGNM